MRVKVLGSAAGGGFPQWNCGCPNCNRLRTGAFKGRERTQAQVGVEATPGKWFLLNASPDLRQQILEDPEFAPAKHFAEKLNSAASGVKTPDEKVSFTPELKLRPPKIPSSSANCEETRSTPIFAIFLTSADVDCVMGLLHLREFQPLTIYATESVRRVVTEENSLFRTLERSNPPVRWAALPLGEQIRVFQDSVPGKSVSCTAVSVGGNFPDYVSDSLRKSLREEEATIGLEFAEGGKKVFYAPNLPGRGEEWKRHAKESNLALLDGTFWTDDELVRVRGSGKTAREMGHLPLSGAGGLLEQLGASGKGRRVLIHMNNTNPVLDEESAANRAVCDAKWEIAHDGMEIEL